MPYMFKSKRIVLLFIILIFLFTGCTTINKFFSRNSNENNEKGFSEEEIAVTENEEEFSEKEITITEVVLGPGDEIEISVWRNRDLNGKHRVDSAGRIFMPLVGALDVQGVSVFALRDKIIESLTNYLVDPQVEVTVTSYRSRKIYVLGEVYRPGIFPMEEQLTLIGALAMAGGLTKDAKSKSVVLLKGGLENKDAKVFDIDSLLEEGGAGNSEILGSGDIVYVASSFISSVDRFFDHFSTMIKPIWTAARTIAIQPAVEDVLRNGGNSYGRVNTGSTIIISSGE